MCIRDSRCTSGSSAGNTPSWRTGGTRTRDVYKRQVLTMAVGMLGATVKIGGFIPRVVASTPTRSIPHIPMGAGWAAPSAAINSLSHTYDDAKYHKMVNLSRIIKERLAKIYSEEKYYCLLYTSRCVKETGYCYQ